MANILHYRFVRWVVLPIVAVFILYNYIIYPTVTLKYLLTLEVTTPNGPKTGSGVIQVSYASEINLNGGGRRGSVSVVGEAIPVDLGQGKFLFVTLTSNASGRTGSQSGLWNGPLDAQRLPMKVFDLKWDWGEEWRLPSLISAARARGPQDVDLKNLPTLVTFKDINDPITIQLVQPHTLNSTFGVGYDLTKVTMEITDGQVSHLIRTQLKWLSKYPEPRLSPPSSGSDWSLAATLSTGDFIMGEN